MDSWRVTWRDKRGEEQSREYPTFMEAWTFVEETLKGKAEVTLVTDRAPVSDREQSFKSEAAAARQQEGGRRLVRKK